MSYMRLCPVPQRATFSRQGAVTRPGVQSGFEAFDFVTGVELSATFAQLVQLCPALGQFPASPALTTEQHPINAITSTATTASSHGAITEKQPI